MSTSQLQKSAAIAAPVPMLVAGTRTRRNDPGAHRARPADPLPAGPRYSGGPRISIVMPTLNEGENLPHVLAQMPPVHELIVVDGNSTDDTIAVALLHPRTRVIQQPGRGKGDALRAGCDAATGDIIVMLDADGSTDPNEIPRFVEALLAGADFAKGSRFLPEGGSTDLTPVRRFGAMWLTGIVNILFGTRYTDLCYGYNACWRDVVDSLDITASGFEVETLMNIRAATAGLRVAEIPSFELSRLNGESHLRVVRDGLRVARTIVRERTARRPGKTRSAPGAVLYASR
jgi:glycosyltransferase involved in cell wall biosynthesis